MTGRHLRGYSSRLRRRGCWSNCAGIALYNDYSARSVTLKRNGRAVKRRILSGSSAPMRVMSVKTRGKAMIDLSRSRPLAVSAAARSGDIKNGFWAVHYWYKAGKKSVARSAHNEATGHLNQGLDQLPNIDDSTLRNKSELRLQTLLGNSLRAVRRLNTSRFASSIAKSRISAASAASLRSFSMDV